MSLPRRLLAIGHGFAAALLGVLVLACGRPAAPPAPGARLRVAVQPYLAYAPLYVARDSGHFAAEGIAVEFLRLPSTTAEVTLLARGALDVVPARLTVALLSALAGGARLAAVADLAHVDPAGCVQTAIVARPQIASGSVDASALIGRTIELERASVESHFVDLLLAPLGHASDELRAVNLDDPLLAEAFDAGTIDFAHTSEPWLSRLVRGGHAVVWRSANTVAPEFQLAFLLFGPTLLDRQPELGERFLAAYLRAVDDLARGLSPAARERLAAAFGLGADELATLCQTPIRADGAIRLASVEEFQRWALERGLLAAPAPLGQFWDGRFAAAVVARRDPSAGDD